MYITTLEIQFALTKLETHENTKSLPRVLLREECIDK